MLIVFAKSPVHEYTGYNTFLQTKSRTCEKIQGVPRQRHLTAHWRRQSKLLYPTRAALPILLIPPECVFYREYSCNWIWVRACTLLRSTQVLETAREIGAEIIFHATTLDHGIVGPEAVNTTGFSSKHLPRCAAVSFVEIATYILKAWIAFSTYSYKSTRNKPHTIKSILTMRKLRKAY